MSAKACENDQGSMALVTGWRSVDRG